MADDHADAPPPYTATAPEVRIPVNDLTLANSVREGHFNLEGSKYLLPKGIPCTVQFAETGTEARWQLRFDSHDEDRKVPQSGAASWFFTSDGNVNDQHDTKDQFIAHGGVTYLNGVRQSGTGSRFFTSGGHCFNHYGIGNQYNNIGGTQNISTGTGLQLIGVTFTGPVNFGSDNWHGGVTPSASTTSQQHAKPKSCTLTITIPSGKHIGTVDFDSDNHVKLVASGQSLNAYDLSVKASLGIGLPPVDVTECLRLESVSGLIDAKNAVAKRYILSNEFGKTIVHARYPQLDSVIQQGTGGLEVSMTDTSENGAELTINTSRRSRSAPLLDFLGFEGTFDARETNSKVKYRFRSSEDEPATAEWREGTSQKLTVKEGGQVQGRPLTDRVKKMFSRSPTNQSKDRIVVQSESSPAS